LRDEDPGPLLEDLDVVPVQRREQRLRRPVLLVLTRDQCLQRVDLECDPPDRLFGAGDALADTAW